GRARSTEPPRATGRTRSGGRVPARRARACRCAAGGSPMIAAVSAVARADFLDRARRPAFPVTVFGALALGFLAVPPESARYAMVKVGTFRGVYDSAYIGTMLAMIGSLWLPLFGFYVVRNALGRDTASGVGELLAATPVRTPAYLLGKYLGNLAVLGAMAAALAAIAPVMQLLRGESTTIDPIGLWLPLVLFCLPALAVGAAAAVVFESIPFLGGGCGNFVWSFPYPALSLATPPRLYSETTAGFQDDVAAQYPGANTEISIGLTMEEHGLGRFVWAGPDFGLPVVVASLAPALAATVAAAAPSLWFPRFDPARQRNPAPAAPVRADAPAALSGPAPAPSTSVPEVLRDNPARAVGPADPRASRYTKSVVGPFVRLLTGAVRIHLGGVSRWWWLGLATLTVIALSVPEDALGTVLLFAWLWPVLLWSRLGTHAAEAGVDTLLRS